MDGAGTRESPILVFGDAIRKDNWWTGDVDLSETPEWIEDPAVNKPFVDDSATRCAICGSVLVDGEEMIEDPGTKAWMHLDHLKNTGINGDTEYEFGYILPEKVPVVRND